jgi:uncharacterized protein YcbK (DUF882 family)
MKINRRIVPLHNFHALEGNCKCGCGMEVDPQLMLKLQAFIYILERTLNTEIQCIITSGARCIKHNTKTYNGIKTSSFHCGIKRGDTPEMYGAAVDCVFKAKQGDEFVVLPKDAIAEYAITSGLFGGVGWKKYHPTLAQFIHLDLGFVREF